MQGRIGSNPKEVMGRRYGVGRKYTSHCEPALELTYAGADNWYTPASYPGRILKYGRRVEKRYRD